MRADPMPRCATGEHQQRQQHARVVTRLQIDDEVVARRTHLAHPAQQTTHTALPTAQIVCQHTPEARVAFEQPVPGRQHVEVDGATGKGAHHVIEGRARHDDVTHRAPLDDEDAADAVVGGQIDNRA